MKSQVLDEPNFEREEQVFNARILLIKSRNRNGMIALALFLLLALGIALYRYLLIKDITTDGRFYHNLVQLSYSNISSSQQPNNEGSLAVTQQQLRTMAWTILHMSAATFPQNFQSILAEKFNIFLILFGQIYPCKTCGNTFLKKLHEMQPFNGTNRSELTQYLCKLHNKISVEIGLEADDCSKVDKEWRIDTNSL